MPPRRRAFRSNDFGLEPTTIPLDASRLAEPPSRQGTLFRQNHFHFNPSRMLVEHYSRYAANNAQPRLMVLLRRNFPAHRPFPGVAALPNFCPYPLVLQPQNKVQNNAVNSIFVASINVCRINQEWRVNYCPSQRRSFMSRISPSIL